MKKRSGRATFPKLIAILLIMILIIGCADNDSSSDPNLDVVANESNGTQPTTVSPTLDAGAVAASGKIKLQVEGDGVYRVSLDTMRSAGIQIDSINPSDLSLTNEGEQVPYLVDGDNLIFYGRGSDSRYSTERTYILEAGKMGLLMQEGVAPAIQSPVLDTVTQQVRVEKNLYYEQRAAESEGEVWFWKRIVSDGPDAKMELQIDLPSGVDGDAILQMHFYGLTYNNTVELDHDINIIVNDQAVGMVQFDGATYHLSELPLAAGTLREGTNTILIDNSEFGAAFVDHVYLDYVAVSYEAPTTAINDKLLVKGSDGVVNVGGFSIRPLILNASDPQKPFVINGGNYADGEASIGVTGDMHVELIGENGFLNVKTAEPVRSTTLRDSSNQADLLIVTTRELAPGLDDLVEARKAQGLNAHIAFIDDIADEFGHGATNPQAIREFVTYAANNWTQPAPRYLFLVGEATTDTLGYEANRPIDPITPPNNIIPSEIIKVNFGGETVSDARLADVDGDLKPDLAVGRWPVDTVNDVERLVKRTLEYEQGAANSNAVFTSDPSSPTEFVNFTSRLIENTNYPTETALRFESEDNSDMLEAWEDAWLVTYVGHGSLELWGEDELLTKDQVDDINFGDTPPIVLQFSCLTGQFAHPSKETISETMLIQNDGPVILIAATSLTLSGNQSPFAISLINAMKSPANPRIGDALQAAKVGLDTSNAGLQEISDTFGMIGDPTALIARPDAIVSAP